MMLRAIKTFDFMRRRLRPGDLFEADTAATGRVLVQAKLAAAIDDDDDDPPPKRKKQKYKTRHLQAEDE